MRITLQKGVKIVGGDDAVIDVDGMLEATVLVGDVASCSTQRRDGHDPRVGFSHAKMTGMRGVFETVLYAPDLEAAADFYTRVLRLELVSRSETLVGFRCGQGMLLVFDPELSSKAGRSVPAHGTAGNGHVAFATPADELDSWRGVLAEHGVAIESEVEFTS